MQINTGSPLGHHWVLASASVVPVAYRCTFGSSGFPLRSVQWYPSVLTESGLEVIRVGHFPACNLLCIPLLWWKLFELSWFNFTCNAKYTKNYNGADIICMHKAEFTETCPLADWCPAILSFQTGVDATLLDYICLGVYGLLQALQWCSSVGCKVRLSPVAFRCGAVSTRFLPVVFQCTLQYSLGRPVVSQCTLSQPVAFQWHSSVHWTSQRTLAQDRGINT